MSAAIDRFLDHLRRRNASPNTLRAYAGDLADLDAFLVRAGAGGEITVAHLRDWAADMKSRDLASSTRARRVAAAKSFFRWLLDRKVISTNPAAGLRTPRRTQRLPRLLGHEEIERLLEIRGTDAEAVRDRAILETLYSTGCRVSELVALDLGDVKEEVVTLRGKGMAERLGVLGEPAVRAVRQWLGVRGARPGETALFVSRLGRRLDVRSIRRLLVKRLREAGLPEDAVHVHGVRHSCATHMMDRGAGIRDVQELLGHRSIESTAIYARVSLGRQLDVYAAAHPRA